MQLKYWLVMLRYQPIRLFCWLMRKWGWDVMLYPDHFGHQAGDVEFDLRTKKKKLLYLAGTTPNRALRRMHERHATIIDVSKWLWVNCIEADIGFDILSEKLSRQLTIYQFKEVWASKPKLEFS